MFDSGLLCLLYLSLACLDVTRDYCDTTLVNGGGDVNAKISTRITTTLLMIVIMIVLGIRARPGVRLCWRRIVGSVSMSNKFLLKSAWLIDSVLGPFSSTNREAWETSGPV